MENASIETLFRFATFRKPEPVKGDGTKFSFIFHPTKGESGSYFSEEIATPQATFELQMIALKNKAKSYEGTELLDEAGLIDLIGGDRIVFSEWFSENSEDIFNQLVTPTTEQLVENLNSEQSIQLWDTVFYSIITSKTATFRKKIVDILQADYYLYWFKDNSETGYQYANAKLTIPKGFFALKDDDAVASNNTNTTQTNPHFAINKEFEDFKLLHANRDAHLGYSLLEKELLKIKKQYDADFKIAYDAVFKSHSEDVRVGYENAEYTIDPDTGKRIYTNLNLPTFNFTYTEPELNSEILLNKLSANAYAVAEQLEILEESTFAEALEVISENRKELSNENIAITNVQDTTTVIGGTVITSMGRIFPQSSNTKDFNIEPICLNAKSDPIASYYKLRMFVNTGSVSTNITSCSCSVNLGSGKTTSAFNDIENTQTGSSVKAIDIFILKTTTNVADNIILNHSDISAMDNTITLQFKGIIKLSNNEFWKFAFDLQFDQVETEKPNSIIWTSYLTNDIYGQMTLDGTSSSADDNVDDCLPTNIEITASATNDNKDLYTINFNAPVNTGATTLNLEYTYKTPINWLSAINTVSSNANQTQITLSKGSYLFRFRVVSAGGCMDKVTKSFSYDGTCTPSNGNGTTTSETFIPSQYGVKSLGIAEFRRVEQTLCCYEPGEVSAIENIMKGEYREKGSRKLHRTETTDTTETTTETESLSDTVTSERFSMQSQVASVLNQSINANAHVEYHGAIISAGAAFGFNSSKQESSSHAVNYGKDVTTRALERVVQKVREERIVKITDEFEETNKHGYDNRGVGGGHISGVYRFIDKVYKNQIFNYGKRLMYEFVIPQPSKFHTEAIKTINSISVTTLDKPTDPRDEINKFSAISEDWVNKWASTYNVKVSEKPAAIVNQGLTYSAGQWGGGVWEVHQNGGPSTSNDGTGEMIKIPKGYKTKSASIYYTCTNDGDSTQGHLSTLILGNRVIIANNAYGLLTNNGFPTPETISLSPFENEIPYRFMFVNFIIVSISITLTLELKEEVLNAWKNETFNAIITAYEDKLREYNDALNAAKSANEQKTTNPLFYRQIENICLKKNCIDYLVPAKYLGQDFYNAAKGIGKDGIKLNPSAAMEEYANRCRFLEEAFDWGIMSYKFYPFYWGNSVDWAAMYQIESDDPLFANFMQAGMSRVVVPVRQGFETAVMYYMTTGKVWNGTDKILIDLSLHKAVEFEMANQEYTIEKTWKTKVPSSLTMIQEGSVGLERPANGLPCDCGDTTYTPNGDLQPITP